MNKPDNRKKIRKLPAAAEAYKFKPGQSGNPGGRPKKTWLTEVTEEMLEEKMRDPKARNAFKAALWEKLLSGRVVGSMTLDTLWNRTEGTVTQKFEGELNISLADVIKQARERSK